MNKIASFLSAILGSIRKAVENEEVWKLKLLLSADSELANTPDVNDLQPPLLIAAAQNKLASAESLLVHGAKHNACDPHNNATPLHWAAYEGHSNMISLLVRYGASIDSVETCGQQPLHWAARKGNDQAANVLIRLKADVDALDHRGASPIFYAIEHNRENMVKILLRNKARVDITDVYSETPLTYAEDASVNPNILLLIKQAAV